MLLIFLTDTSTAPCSAPCVQCATLLRDNLRPRYKEFIGPFAARLSWLWECSGNRLNLKIVFYVLGRDIGYSSCIFRVNR